jgi:phosphohistidine phosphatase
MEVPRIARMKRILLLRHAKSSWGDAALGDFERPLAPRGVRAAETMAGYLVAEGLTPDLVLCSAARRTVETWNHLAGALGRKATVVIEPELYLAEAGALLDRLRAVPPDVATVLLIGHNPGMESLARILGGTGDAGARRRLATKFPTAALAVIDFDIAGWPDLAKRKGRLDRFITPKEIG